MEAIIAPGCTDNDEIFCNLIATGTLSCDYDFAHKCNKTCSPDCGDRVAASVGHTRDRAGWAVPLACGASMVVLIAGVAIHRKHRSVSTHTRLPDDATAKDTPELPQAMTEGDEDCERTVLNVAI
jgi:hypothetical protein